MASVRQPYSDGSTPKNSHYVDEPNFSRSQSQFDDRKAEMRRLAEYLLGISNQQPKNPTGIKRDIAPQTKEQQSSIETNADTAPQTKEEQSSIETNANTAPQTKEEQSSIEINADTAPQTEELDLDLKIKKACQQVLQAMTRVPPQENLSRPERVDLTFPIPQANPHNSIPKSNDRAPRQKGNG